MALDAQTFDTLADETLEGFMDRIEDQLGDQLDIDLEGGILKIELDVGGEYVINKHGPNQEIWMSSPVSGATHYAYDDGEGVWKSTRSSDVLPDVLAAELSAKTGMSIVF